MPIVVTEGIEILESLVHPEKQLDPIVWQLIKLAFSKEVHEEKTELENVCKSGKSTDLIEIYFLF